MKKLKLKHVIQTFCSIPGMLTLIKGKEVCLKLIKVGEKTLLKRLGQLFPNCPKTVGNSTVKKNLLEFRRILYLKHQKLVIELKFVHRLVTYVTSCSIILMLLLEANKVMILPQVSLRGSLRHLKVIKECSSLMVAKGSSSQGDRGSMRMYKLKLSLKDKISLKKINKQLNLPRAC